MGPTKEVFKSPRHSYTRALLDSTPSIKGEKKKLKSLEGEPPSLIDKNDGCTLAPRCPDRETKCNPEQHMSLIEVSPEHFVDICSIGKDN